ncbi:hypothetical protein DFW101_2354 [Solidesulfovibrio carbinoliphilus subsp. oakridgensis]|uniref:Uncharacterized protein n=1 Tax=Solidesulfovibrio carbinoliphilus subsp. oakridgensis TaxID=694327 RepID=G7QB17_9BACT|nr:hypothetical protein [Solidesulfovibrio carbinoliphilus]EHJ48358.1 hypothetical protein DFW101_2354 [Solidesulfovibrio carbinoliphilus subsp. oakridgensis]
MTEQRLLRTRSLLGWLATLCCLCAGLALADSFVNSMHTGPNTFSILAGGTENLSGPMPPDASDASAMRATTDHPGLSLELSTQAQGFWLGNRMWLALVKAAPDVSPGTATITLRGPSGDTAAPAQIFTLLVFPDQAALNAASHSRIRRAFGLPPLAVAAGGLVAAMLVGFCVFLTSRRVEAIWKREGKAVVYMTKKTPDGLLISFGLGTEHGLATGAAVAVHDESGLPVAVASVVRCSGADAAALVVGDGKVALGNIVSRPSATETGKVQAAAGS